MVARLEAGDLPPWRQPIRSAGGDPSPRNLRTDKTYRGVNYWLLLLRSWERGYERPLWLTFRQAKERDAEVRKGEKGTRVIFWKQYEKPSEQKPDDEKSVVQVIKHYTVFNVAQVDGLELDPLPDLTAHPFDPIANAEKILAGYAGGPEVEHTGNRAAYLPGKDRVVIAEPGRFETPEAYYATLFHELTHSTGHSSRLDRGIDEKLAPFGSSDYSKEELVAEMGAAYLCAVAGISQPTIDQSAAYLEGWLGRFQEDKKLIVQAAGQAQRAADRILGVVFDDASNKPRSDAARPLPMQAQPNHDVGEAILRLLKTRPGESLTGTALRQALGMTDYTRSDPLANPVNAALKVLRDRGVIHAEETRWGDPRFSVLRLPERAAELEASHCPATLAGAEARRLLRQNGWKICDFAERWGFTQKRVREVLACGLDNPNAVHDWIKAALTAPGHTPSSSVNTIQPHEQLGLW